MSDLISRQQAIEAAECIVEHHAITPYKTMAAAMDHLKRILNGMPSAQPKWIPVTERLPDEWKRVLIQNDEGLFLVGFVKDRGWGKEWYYQYEMYDYDAYEEFEQGKIVAWCELPDRWRGEQG